MNIKELIKHLEILRQKYGDDIEVCKVKNHDYLASILSDQIVYNCKENKIEI